MGEACAVEAARAAFARSDWVEARRRFLEVPADELAPDDWESLAEAAWWAGEIDQTLSAYERASEGFVRSGDTARAAMAALFLGAHASESGQRSRGAGWVARARRMLDGCPDCPARAYPSYFSAFDAMARGDLDEAEEHGLLMLQTGRRFGDPNLVALGVLVQGRVLVKQRQVHQGMALLDEAMVAALSDDLHPKWAGTLLCHLMDVCHELSDVERAWEWTTATARWCTNFPAAALFRGICRVHRSQLLTVQGAWREAEQEADAACADLASVHVGVLAEAYYQIGELRRLRGDLDAAAEAYDEAHRHGRDPQPGLALLLLEHRRLRAAATGLVAALHATPAPLSRVPLQQARVEIALAADDRSTAEAAAHELERVAGNFGTGGLRAAARRARGAVLVASGRYDEAVGPLRAACTTYQAAGARYDTATVRVLLASALRGLGDEEGARREATEACALFESLAAEPALRRARRFLGEDEPQPAGLTRREAEVLGLVATGMTNRQVARRLGLSEKTVSRHLEHIFTKLEVGSRAAATAFAVEHGLVGRE
jgi:DNA-binding NarL/FixJ family response regulator